MRSSFDIPSARPPDTPEKWQPDDPLAAPPIDTTESPELMPPPTPPSRTLVPLSDDLDDPLMRPPKLGQPLEVNMEDADDPDEPDNDLSRSRPSQSGVPAIQKEEWTHDDTQEERVAGLPPHDGMPPVPPTGGGETGDVAGDDDGNDQEITRDAARDYGAEVASRLVVKEHVEISGPMSDDASMRQDVKDFFHHPDANRRFDGEIELTDAHRELIETSQKIVRQVAANVGVDVSDRFFALDEHHVFADKEKLREALEAIGRSSAEKLEGGNSSDGIFALEQPTRLESGFLYVHETLHSVAQRSIELMSTGEVAEDGGPVMASAVQREGYAVAQRREDGSYALKNGVFNEMAVDLATLHGFSEFTDIESYVTHYSQLVTVGAGLIEKVAEQNGEDPMEALKRMETELFTGTTATLGNIAAVFGEEAVALLENESHVGRLSDALLERLSLPAETVDKLAKMKEGKVVEGRPRWMPGSRWRSGF